MSKDPSLFPLTISREAQKLIQALTHNPIPATPHHKDYSAWEKRNEDLQATGLIRAQKILKKWELEVHQKNYGKVPVLELTPPNWQEGQPFLLYLHGGAFTAYNSFTQLSASAPLAARSGLKLVSIDYSLAPQAGWKIIQQEILTVIQVLIDEGYDPRRMGLIGDSAGGNLALVTTLAMRDSLRIQPSSLVLWSPWADLRNQGDSAITLKNFDPILNYESHLKESALAYAGDQDLADPRISPIYADYRKGFPPTLIQESTRTIFLSTSVRLYRELVRAKVAVTLDMYEGMPHGFHLMDLPESQEAIGNSLIFLKEFIGY